jgi:hypothetical protein
MQSASRIVLLIAAAGLAVAAPLARDTLGPSRADLDLARRKVAVLESELSLARSRKPYLVVDAQGKMLRYRLLGVTMREIPLSGLRIDGLRREEERGTEGPLTLAGIVTLKEKENDPRLSPLTPEQIEAGAADENVADALPPEAPADFEVEFKQPLSLRVEGVAGKKSVWSPSSWLSRLWRGGGKGKEPRVRLTAHLEETAARELYRSLIPGTRLLVVPPAGFRLPDIGQEPPSSVHKGRPPRVQPRQPATPSQDVPFRIPPPVAETPADGTTTTVDEQDRSTGDGSATPSEVEEPQPTPEAPAQPAASPGPESGGGA